MKFILEYASLINIALLITIIGFLFHLYRASRNSLLDSLKAKEDLHALHKDNFQNQKEILELISNKNFIAEIKHYREHYEEKSSVLSDKLKSKSDELKILKAESERSEGEISSLLQSLGVGKPDLLNVMAAIRKNVEAERDRYFSEVVKQTCTPQLSNFFHRHHFTFILGRTSVSQV